LYLPLTDVVLISVWTVILVVLCLAAWWSCRRLAQKRLERRLFVGDTGREASPSRPEAVFAGHDFPAGLEIVSVELEDPEELFERMDAGPNSNNDPVEQ